MKYLTILILLLIGSFLFGQCPPEEPIYGPYCENSGLKDIAAVEFVTKWSGDGITDNGDGTATFDTDMLPDSYTITYSYNDYLGCEGEADFVVEILEVLTPEFSFDTNYCEGDDFIILPSVSDNMIEGSWDGDINTSIIGAQNFEFSSTVDICAATFTTEIIVFETTIPTFSFQTEFCVGDLAPGLPVFSDNGIEGSWNDEINTTFSGTQSLVFMSNLDTCVSQTIIEVSISENIVPEFDFQTEFCVGEEPYPLPTMSANGVLGIWSPAVINPTAAGQLTATFIADNSFCSTPFSQLVSIYTSIEPSFDIVSSLCQFSTPPHLPNTSNNGLSGSWSPSTIDVTEVGSKAYTFTPDNQCGNVTSIDVLVVEKIIPLFPEYGPYCKDVTALELSQNSNNGIAGTWVPDVINTANPGTSEYGFTPNNDECSFDYSTSVVIHELPVLNLSVEESSANVANDGDLCQGDNLEFNPNVSNGRFPYQYRWSGQTPLTDIENPTINFVNQGDEGEYNLQVTDANSCTAQSSIVIEVLENPRAIIELNAPSEEINKKFDLTSKSVADNPGAFIRNIQWDFSKPINYLGSYITSSQLVELEDCYVEEINNYTFSLLVTDSNGCNSDTEISRFFSSTDNCGLTLEPSDNIFIYCDNQPINGFVYKPSGNLGTDDSFKIEFFLDEMAVNPVIEFNSETDGELNDFELLIQQPGQYSIYAKIFEDENAVGACDGSIIRFVKEITVLPKPRLVNLTIDSLLCTNVSNDFNVIIAPEDFDYEIDYTINDNAYSQSINNTTVNIDKDDLNVDLLNVITVIQVYHQGLSSCSTGVITEAFSFEVSDCREELNEFSVDSIYYCASEIVNLSTEFDTTGNLNQFFIISKSPVSLEYNSRDELQSNLDDGKGIIVDSDLFSFKQYFDVVTDYTYGKPILIRSAYEDPNEGGRITVSSKEKEFSFYPIPEFCDASQYIFCDNVVDATLQATIKEQILADNDDEYPITASWIFRDDGILEDDTLSGNRITNFEENDSTKFIESSAFFDLSNLDAGSYIDKISVVSTFSFIRRGSTHRCSNSMEIPIQIIEESAPDRYEIRWWQGNILSSLAPEEKYCYKWGKWSGVDSISYPKGLPETLNGIDSTSNTEKFYYPVLDSGFLDESGLPSEDKFFVNLSYRNSDGSCPSSPECVTTVYYDNAGFVLRGNSERKSVNFDVQVYPNPSQGLFNVNISETVTEPDIIIYNIEGKEIFRQTSDKLSYVDHFTVDYNFKSAGVYLLSLEIEGNRVYKKIIIH